MELKDFILENWDKTIREVKEPVNRLIPLPKPFTIPSIADYFQEMYYWDTYFTNVGLFVSGLTQQAIDNCENMSYVINKYGFFPNATRTHFLKRSQQPYFAFMVKDVYDVTKNDEWLKERYTEIKREYDWWMTNRITELGLNRYGDSGETIEACKENGFYALHRMKVQDFKGDVVTCGRNHFAVCESGWDTSPRFGERCMYACPIDLNCNLYFYETFLGELQEKFNINDGIDWQAKASKRKNLIDKYLWNEEKQIYLDYDFVEEKQFDCLNAAAFQPYFVGLADESKRQGLENCYKLFVKEYGVASTDRYYGNFQWAYPNGWAPNNYIAYHAFKNYGLNEYANEVADKYMILIERVFKETGTTFEKYNVVEGNDSTYDEGTASDEKNNHHTMMGWTTGVYMYFYDLKNRNK